MVEINPNLSTTVTLSKPTTKIKPYLNSLPKGAFFTIANDEEERVYIKTNVTYARGYQCVDVCTGQQHPISYEIEVDVVYLSAQISLGV